jgi:hypothetical protein
MSPATSRSAFGCVDPIPTLPETILTNVVLSLISKFPTFSDSVKVPETAVTTPAVIVPDTTTFPLTSNFSFGKIDPIPTLVLTGSKINSEEP